MLVIWSFLFTSRPIDVMILCVNKAVFVLGWRPGAISLQSARRTFPFTAHTFLQFNQRCLSWHLLSWWQSSLSSWLELNTVFTWQKLPAIYDRINWPSQEEVLNMIRSFKISHYFHCFSSNLWKCCVLLSL